MRVFAIFNALILYTLVLVMCFSYYIEFYLGEPPCSLCQLQRFFMMGAGVCLMFNISGVVSIRNISGAILSCILGSVISLYQWSMLLTNDGVSYAPHLFSLPLYIWSTTFFFSLAIALIFVLFFIKERKELKRNWFMNLSYVLFALVLASEVITSYISSGWFFAV